MIKVLVVDDHPLFRQGVVAALTQTADFAVVGEAASVSEALEAVRGLQPDVILMDIRLKEGGNAIELARQVRMDFADIKIVVLTNYSNEPYVRAMIETGVQAYLIKTTPPHEVIDSMRMVMNDQTVFSAPVMQLVAKGYVSSPTPAGAISPEGMTERENQVLQLLATGASNTEMAEILHISESTIGYHLTSIYGKLGARSRTEAVSLAAREGLVVIDERA